MNCKFYTIETANSNTVFIIKRYTTGNNFKLLIINKNIIRHQSICIDKGIKFPGEITTLDIPKSLINETGTTKDIFFFHYFFTKNLKNSIKINGATAAVFMFFIF